VPVEKREVPLRLIMVAPPKGVAIAMQKGKSELVQPVISGDDLIFDLTVHASPQAGDYPRLLGPFVQGPPDRRFVYVNSGRYAGQDHTWSRRAKVPLFGLTWADIEALRPGQRLEGRFTGTAKDGGPTAASIPLLPPGWLPISS
jgi:hypothetical protein